MTSDRNDITPLQLLQRQSIGVLRDLTTARVGLGRSGAGLPTQALLDFTLDHARARDAVHAVFDVAGLMAGLEVLGLDTAQVCSLAEDRATYLKRPDLGRKLAPDARDRLERRAVALRDVVLVIGDGLSPVAVNAGAAGLVELLLPKLTACGISVGPAIVASGARVALGDEIGLLLKARMTIMLIGERPGLSVPHSLGAYLTFAPRPGLTDAERNCVSNIHMSGLSPEEAVFKIAWLARHGLARSVTRRRTEG